MPENKEAQKPEINLSVAGGKTPMGASESESINVQKLKDFMSVNWGKRCKEFQQRCALCEAWKCYYFLTNNDIVQWDAGNLNWIVIPNKWKEIK